MIPPLQSSLYELAQQNPFRTLEEQLAKNIQVRKEQSGPPHCTTFTAELRVRASVSVTNYELASAPTSVPDQLCNRLVSDILAHLYSDRRKVLSALTAEIMSCVASILNRAESASGVLHDCQSGVHQLQDLILMLLQQSGVCAPPPSVSSQLNSVLRPSPDGAIPAGVHSAYPFLDNTAPFTHLNAFYPVEGRGTCPKCGAEMRTLAPPYREDTQQEFASTLAYETLNVCERAAMQIAMSAKWSADSTMIQIAEQMGQVLRSLHGNRRFTERAINARKDSVV